MNLSPVMAVPGLDPGISPGHPDSEKRRVSQIEITGTGPVMTWRVYGQSVSESACAHKKSGETETASPDRKSEREPTAYDSVWPPFG